MMNGLRTGDNLAYYVMDLKTHSLVGKYFSYDPIKLNNYADYFSANPMAVSGEEIDFIMPLCDTIYSYPSFLPKYIIETPGKMASKSQISENTAFYLAELLELSKRGFFTGFLDIFETKNNIYSQCLNPHDGLPIYFFGNKITKTGYYYSSNYHFGKVYQKIPFFRIVHSFDNSLVGVADELSRYEFEFDPEYAEGQQLKYLQSISQEDDNPILFFYDFND
jgi:hypothetical protein